MILYSDESGFWGDSESAYYVRSWVGLENTGSRQTKVLFDRIKPGQEVKWSEPGELLNSRYLPQIEARFFITVSPLDQFRKQNFVVLKAIDAMEESVFSGYRSVEPLTIKAKMKDATKQILFLSYQERQHIINAIDAFSSEFQVSGLSIDTPQFTSGLYKPMLKEIGDIKGIPHENILINKSKDHRELQFADLAAGAFNEFLNSGRPDIKCTTFLKETLKPKMLNMSSKTSPNPNMIYWDPGHPLPGIFNNFRSL